METKQLCEEVANRQVVDAMIWFLKCYISNATLIYEEEGLDKATGDAVLIDFTHEFAFYRTGYDYVVSDMKLSTLEKEDILFDDGDFDKLESLINNVRFIMDHFGFDFYVRRRVCNHPDCKEVKLEDEIKAERLVRRFGNAFICFLKKETGQN